MLINCSSPEIISVVQFLKLKTTFIIVRTFEYIEELYYT